MGTEKVSVTLPPEEGTADPFGKAWSSQSSFPSLLLWDKSLKPLWKENRKKVFRPWRGTGICASPRTLVEEKGQEHWEGHTPATKENSVCPRPRLNPNIRESSHPYEANSCGLTGDTGDLWEAQEHGGRPAQIQCKMKTKKAEGQTDSEENILWQTSHYPTQLEAGGTLWVTMAATNSKPRSCPDNRLTQPPHTKDLAEGKAGPFPRHKNYLPQPQLSYRGYPAFKKVFEA